MEPSFIYEAKGRTLVIHLPRELDHHNCRNLKYETELLMAENYISRILFDFTGTEFMDSSGIGVIIGRSRKMGYFGGEVYAEHLSGRILKIFKVSGLHTLIRTSVPKQQKEREGENHNA